MPLVNRTRATLRRAEFGFLGVCVKTRTQTPRFWGLTWRAGLFVFVTIFSRPWRTSWLIVGIILKNQRTCGMLRPHGSAITRTRLRAAQPMRRLRPGGAAPKGAAWH